MYPTEDPAGVNVVTISPKLDFTIARNAELITTAERVTNINDQSMGRGMSQPNAPNTATGQLALIEEGNVRAYLDNTILKEDMELILGDIWELDCDLVPKTNPGQFFRVTEERANGLFDVKQGGAYMQPDEFAGRYDFRLKFATSHWARQAKKAEFFAFYQAAMASPLVMQNPRAMWVLLNKLAKECGVDDFNEIIPEPPELDQPKQPDAEWTAILEGEQIQVNPNDHDDLHIQQHIQQIEDERKNPNRDEQAITLGVQHILDHQQQKRTKMLMQAMTSQLMQTLAPGPQNPAMQSLQQLSQMYGGGQPSPIAGGPQAQTPPGDIPPPTDQVGSSAAPQPQEGML